MYQIREDGAEQRDWDLTALICYSHEFEMQGCTFAVAGWVDLADNAAFRKPKIFQQFEEKAAGKTIKDHKNQQLSEGAFKFYQLVVTHF